MRWDTQHRKLKKTKVTVKLNGEKKSEPQITQILTTD